MWSWQPRMWKHQYSPATSLGAGRQIGVFCKWSLGWPGTWRHTHSPTYGRKDSLGAGRHLHVCLCQWKENFHDLSTCGVHISHQTRCLDLTQGAPLKCLLIAANHMWGIADLCNTSYIESICSRENARFVFLKHCSVCAAYPMQSDKPFVLCRIIRPCQRNILRIIRLSGMTEKDVSTVLWLECADSDTVNSV